VGGVGVKRNIPTVIIEPRTLLREGLAALLQDTCYKVVASIESISEIPDLKLPPEHALLIILGLSCGRDETLRAVQCVRQAVKVAKLVAVGERLGDHSFQEILNGGVDAIVFNVGSSDALLTALELTLIGQQVVILGRQLESRSLDHGRPPPAVDDTQTGPISRSEAASDSETRSLGLPNPHTQLSGREQQVLICVARGESNKTIARSCSITEATVKVHLQSILRKISARNRTQAALWAVENGLVAKTVLESNGAHDGG
jgi:two-component system, NarL family, nitrate/nitrite response regulator NarL